MLAFALSGHFALVAVLEQRPGVLRVIRLVEYHRVRGAELPEAQHPRDESDQDRNTPRRPPRHDRRGARGETEESTDPHIRLRERRHQTLPDTDPRPFHIAEATQPHLPSRRRIQEVVRLTIQRFRPSRRRSLLLLGDGRRDDGLRSLAGHEVPSVGGWSRRSANSAPGSGRSGDSGSTCPPPLPEVSSSEAMAIPVIHSSALSFSLLPHRPTAQQPLHLYQPLPEHRPVYGHCRTHRKTGSNGRPPPDLPYARRRLCPRKPICPHRSGSQRA